MIGDTINVVEITSGAILLQGMCNEKNKLGREVPLIQKSYHFCTMLLVHVG